MAENNQIHWRGVGAAVLLLIASTVVLAQPATTAPATQAFAPVADQAHLQNAHVVTPKIISGAQPEGPEGFKALADLGIKTIISVDGAVPDVEGAKAFGMRYVHIPITYATVTPDQEMALAKAFEELPGPIYVHCHHGKHRSAAAVATACVVNGMLKPEQAESVLQTFGTGANYTGLWQAARQARPVDPKVLMGFKTEFRETVKPAGIAETMVSMDELSENLKTSQAIGWKAPANHPDFDPAHEALQLQEHLTELGRTDAAKAKPAQFQQLLADGQKASESLTAALRAKPLVTATADAAMKQMTVSCNACHATYRD